MIYEALTVLPYPNLERATAALRAELRHKALKHGPSQVPDWSTLEVIGPVESTDARGQVWFEYLATVQSRPLRG